MLYLVSEKDVQAMWRNGPTNVDSPSGCYAVDRFEKCRSVGAQYAHPLVAASLQIMCQTSRSVRRFLIGAPQDCAIGGDMVYSFTLRQLLVVAGLVANEKRDIWFDSGSP